MIKKSMIAVLTVIALVALVFAASGSLDNNNKDNKSSNDSSSNQEKQQDSSTTKITTQQNTTTIISSEKAQQLAQKFIEQPGATAGTPQLTEMDGKSFYVVPVMIDGKSVGEIDIDAQTGENLGGAGGVS